MQHSFTKRLLLAISLITTTTYATDINLALDKVATQSSSYRNYTPASKAVDGNTDGIWNNGSMASTNKEQGAWWQVDLGDTKTINRIVIYNRTDCCSNRLSNYQVSVSATSDFTTPTYQQTFSTRPDPSNTIDLGGIQGRYVKIQLLGNNYLSLAEVKIMGTVASTGANLSRFIVKYNVSDSDVQAQSLANLEMRFNQVISDLGVSVASTNHININQISGDKYFDVIGISAPINQATLKQITDELSKDSNINYAEPDYIGGVNQAPNDPRYNEQWHYNSPTAGINLEAAWDITTGSSDTVVAVIDTGVSPHIDLSNLLPGYDFANNDSDANDDHRHGTHVAGTIAASTDNNEGVAGVNWQAKILPVKVLDDKGSGTISNTAKGIRWAAGLPISGAPDNANPAKVMNISLRWHIACSNSQTMQDAINDAVNQGTTVVVAAGNENTNANTKLPAGCNNVISVAANNSNANRAGFSNYGNTVDVIAPGVNILSLSHTGGYRTDDGTSMAAPHVAGVISLMLAQNDSLSPAMLEQLLKDNTTAFTSNSNCHPDHANYNNKACGTGRVDAAKALVASLTQPGIPGPPGPPGSDGKDGADGKDGKDGADGKDGKDGADGKDGKDGKDGADGDTFFTQIGNEVSLQGQNDLTVTDGNFITTGYVQVGNSSAVCDNINTGAIRYNTSRNLLEFCNATIWQAIASSTPDRLSATGKLNDTGMTWGGDYPSDNNNTCTGETVSAQDCSHGRDAATLTKVGAGSAGFDFTKLDSNGEALPASASTWSCVQDNHTGLIWEAKTNDGELHDQSDTYTWYNADASTNGGNVGTENDSNACYGYDSSNPATYCNTQAFVARVNNAGLCGINNWKLPDMEQLRSIVDYSRTNPAIDTDYFANTPASKFWSSSPYSNNSYDAWYINFSYGYDYNYNRNNNDRVRLVRDGQ